VFPVVRPFSRSFQDDQAAFTLNVSSTAWLIAHLVAMLALVLLPLGLFTLYAVLARSRLEKRALVALVMSIAGIGLILPVMGVEAFALPALGRAYWGGMNDLAAEVNAIYFGGDLVACCSAWSCWAWAGTSLPM